MKKTINTLEQFADLINQSKSDEWKNDAYDIIEQNGWFDLRENWTEGEICLEGTANGKANRMLIINDQGKAIILTHEE